MSDSLNKMSNLKRGNEQIFLKNEQKSGFAEKTSNSLIRSFLVSDLSDLLKMLFTKRELANFLKTLKTFTKKANFIQIFLSKCSVFVSQRANDCRVGNRVLFRSVRSALFRS